MSLTRAEPRFEGAFEAINCPVCGSDEWLEQPREGVFCEECNCHATLRSTNGDPGFIVDFDAGYCWSSSVDESQLIPVHDGRRTAFAKFMGSPGSYTRVYLTAHAHMLGTEDTGWRAAWNRETNEAEVSV